MMTRCLSLRSPSSSSPLLVALKTTHPSVGRPKSIIGANLYTRLPHYQPRRALSSTQRVAAAFKHTLPVLNMASDSDYMAFLNKANQGFPPDQASATTKEPGFKTVDEGQPIPEQIKKVTTDRFYMSDADEPFVPVCLKWDEAGRELPDEEQLAKLIGYDILGDAEKCIDILDRMAWDPNGKYGDVIQAVEEATMGNPVMIYKIQHAPGSTRVEYWVLSSLGLGKDARLVGAKVLSVES